MYYLRVHGTTPDSIVFSHFLCALARWEVICRLPSFHFDCLPIDILLQIVQCTIREYIALLQTLLHFLTLHRAAQDGVGIDDYETLVG